MAETKPWGELVQIDPNGPMCAQIKGKILCCRLKGHAGRCATPFPSFRRHGPVWVYWIKEGPFGTCHHADPVTHLYCGLEAGHDGDHLAAADRGPGATLAEWSPAPLSAPSTPTHTSKEESDGR